MYEYRQALMRMRQGDSEREIARSKLMGRSKAARFRELARAQGWLDPERPLPEDAEIAAALGQPKLPVTAQSSIAAYRPLVEQWLAQGVSGESAPSSKLIPAAPASISRAMLAPAPAGSSA